jgi:hypothetical protein
MHKNIRVVVVLLLFVCGSTPLVFAQNWSSCSGWDYTIYGNYIVRNNTWGNYNPGFVAPQCMTAQSKNVWTVSAAHTNGTGQVKAYPQCWTGWQKGNGWIVPPAILPQEANAGAPNNVLIDWTFTGPTTGRYLSALDCYTHAVPNPGGAGNGGADDAEWNILIFPHYQDNTGYFQGDTLSPWEAGRHFIDGRWWYVQVNFNSSFGWCKRHMVFKAVSLYQNVNDLNLNAFVQFGRDKGWVTGPQYITSVQAGWELIEGGNGFSTSNFDVAAVPATPPITVNAPTGLGATAVSSSQINLSWTDNATNETAYKVERALAAGGPWTEIAANLPANTTAYSATGLTAATAYFFRVRAANGSVHSGYSNVATTSTNGNPTPPANGIYEAESAVLAGISVSTACATFSGTGFADMQNTGSITFNNVVAQSAGSHTLTVRYAVCNNQQNFVKVNGVTVGGGPASFNGANCCGWQNRNFTVNLNAGNNTVVIEPDWGWTKIDYIQVTPATVTTTIYNETLASDWANWSWGSTVNLSNTSPVQTGSVSARAAHSSTYAAFSLRKGTAHPANNLISVRFWVYSTTARTVTFFTQSGDNNGNSTAVNFTTTANAWKEIIVTRAQLGNPTAIKRITFQTGNYTGDLVYDNIRFLSGGAPALGNPTSGAAVTDRSENPAALEGAIYPNPAQEVLTLSLQSPSSDEQAQLQLCDVVSGRLVLETPLVLSEGENTHVVPLHALNNGQYLVQVVSHGQRWCQRLVVLR